MGRSETKEKTMHFLPWKIIILYRNHDIGSGDQGSLAEMPTGDSGEIRRDFYWDFRLLCTRRSISYK